jgi:hypothetical protein
MDAERALTGVLMDAERASENFLFLTPFAVSLVNPLTRVRDGQEDTTSTADEEPLEQTRRDRQPWASIP